jgi:pantoate--beta-alanine ligase
MSLALERAGWDVVPPLRHGDALPAAAVGVDLLLIATPDDAIANVAAAIDPVSTTVVAHLAGSLGLDVLAPHSRRAAIHPLVAMPDPAMGATNLRGAWFAIAGDDIARDVVASLNGHAFEVADGDRATYHAAACIASNHLVALLGQVERVAKTAGVPLDAYMDLVRATVENVANLGPAAALTGPASRGDEATLNRHRAALAPSEREAYDALSQEAQRLAIRKAPFACVAVADTIEVFGKELDRARADGKTVGLVPTMGALHAGHASLIERAARECDVVAVTIFVNPLQVAANEDLAAYPRNLDADCTLAAAAGARVVFAPPVEEMYPGDVHTTVSVRGVSEVLDGAARPGHFDGVATVVAKLFSIAGACRAYFGEKDFQQLAVVRRMTHDLSMPVDIVGCPTVREPSGLAMSSRNAYLSDAEREVATVLCRALREGLQLVDDGERHPAMVRQRMADVIRTEPSVALDYAEIVRSDDLTVPTVLSGELRLLVAARVGQARLIDNMGIGIPAEGRFRQDRPESSAFGVEKGVLI